MLERVLPRKQLRPTIWMVGVLLAAAIPQWLMSLALAFTWKAAVGAVFGALLTWIATRDGRPRAVVGFTAICSAGLTVEGFAARLLSQGSNGLGLDRALDAAVKAGRSDYYTAFWLGLALGVTASAWLVARIEHRHDERTSALFASHPGVLELARNREESYRLGVWCAILPLVFGLQNIVRLSLRFPLPAFEISGVVVFSVLNAIFLVIASVFIYQSVRRWRAPRAMWVPLVVGWLLASLLTGVWGVVTTGVEVIPLLAAVWLATREPKSEQDNAIAELRAK